MTTTIDQSSLAQPLSFDVELMELREQNNHPGFLYAVLNDQRWTTIEEMTPDRDYDYEEETCRRGARTYTSVEPSMPISAGKAIRRLRSRIRLRDSVVSRRQVAGGS